MIVSVSSFYIGESDKTLMGILAKGLITINMIIVLTQSNKYRTHEEKVIHTKAFHRV